jgi:hypothetical protein
MGKSAHARSFQQIQFLDEFRNADKTPYRALPYLVMAPGLILLITNVGLLTVARRGRA